MRSKIMGCQKVEREESGKYEMWLQNEYKFRIYFNASFCLHSSTTTTTLAHFENCLAGFLVYTQSEFRSVLNRTPTQYVRSLSLSLYLSHSFATTSSIWDLAWRTVQWCISDKMQIHHFNALDSIKLLKLGEKRIHRDINIFMVFRFCFPFT